MKYFLVLLYCTASIAVQAKKEITTQNLIWFAYVQSLQFSPKWYLQTEVQERIYVHPTAQHQFLVRSHLHRTLGAGWETSLGMCLFLQSPHDPKAAIRLNIPELRPHVEFAYKQKTKHLSVDHRYRTEFRFYNNTNDTRTRLEKGFTFSNLRFRYQIQFSIPLLKIDEKRLLKLKIGDEVHLNTTNNTVKNIFDQNRVFSNLSVDALPNLTLEVGYLNWFQQRPNGSFFNRHIVRFSVAHTINLQKEKPKK